MARTAEFEAILKTGRYNREAAKAKKATEEIGENEPDFEEANRGLASLADLAGKIPAPLAAAAAAATAVGAAMAAATAETGLLAIQAERVGLAATQLYNLQDVGTIFGVREGEEFADVISDINERIGEAQEGFNTWTEALVRNGIIQDENEAKLLSTEEALRRILERGLELNQQGRTFVFEDLASNLSQLLPTAEAVEAALEALGSENQSFDELAADARNARQATLLLAANIKNAIGEAFTAAGTAAADFFGLIERESEQAAGELGVDALVRQIANEQRAIREAREQIAQLPEVQQSRLFSTFRSLDDAVSASQARLAALGGELERQTRAQDQQTARTARERQAEADAIGVTVDQLEQYNVARQMALTAGREQATQIAVINGLLAEEADLLAAGVPQSYIDGLRDQRDALDGTKDANDAKAASDRDAARATRLAERAARMAATEEERRANAIERIRMANLDAADRLRLAQLAPTADAGTDEFIQQQTRQLEAQRDIEIRGIREHYRRLNEAAAEEGVTLTADVGAAVEAATLEWQQRIDALSDTSADTAEEVADRYIEAFQGIGDEINDIFSRFEDSTEGWLELLLSGIPRLIAQFRELADAAEGAGGSGGFGALIGNFFGGARQSGGGVTPGRLYLVGERGPELFSPGSSGQIVPNDALGGMGDVTINFPGLDFGSDMQAQILSATPVLVGALREEAIAQRFV